jgi:glucosamine--fructose-6-phosphate aminotransferase (isomerizing)
MCGIIGYIGPKSASRVVLDGLKALEYRGYDSAGIAVFTPGQDVQLAKEVGRVSALERLVKQSGIQGGQSAIGHTRWATHGSPTVPNAHPIANTAKSIFVVHNGIIENHLEIRERLEAKGYIFATETDTEAVPHLIDYYYKQLGSFEEAFKATIHDLRGAYAIVALTSHEPSKLFSAKL